ncbi:MAG: TRAP transporter small permease [Tindallia sp. MSAO_Bac2]|nr:MAG: TRAP transporter small permease [Tindallia sp. MSAO_Bac2]
MNRLKRCFSWLDINFEPIIIMILFLVMLSLITTQVIRRFVFGSGFAWGEEVAVILFAWIAFLGISYAFRNNRQISVDFLRNKLPEKGRKILVVVVDIVMVMLMITLLRGAITNTMSIALHGDNMQSVPVTLNVLYVSAIVGPSLSILRIIQSLVWKIKRYNASYELFLNKGGSYSGASHICFMPKSFKEELDAKCCPETIREEAVKLYRSKGGNDK